MNPTIGILSTVGNHFFATSMDLRLLHQNKISVGSDQLSKFHYFAQKSVPTIRQLLLQMEGTITMRKLRETYWDLEPAMGVAEDGSATAARHDVAKRVARSATTANQPPRS